MTVPNCSHIVAVPLLDAPHLPLRPVAVLPPPIAPPILPLATRPVTLSPLLSSTRVLRISPRLLHSRTHRTVAISLSRPLRRSLCRCTLRRPRLSALALCPLRPRTRCAPRALRRCFAGRLGSPLGVLLSGGLRGHLRVKEMGQRVA